MKTMTDTELVKAVFKGLGGRKCAAGTWIIDANNQLIFHSVKDLEDFLFSWPYPNCLGLIIESAKEMGWRINWRGGEMIYFDKKCKSYEEAESNTAWYDYPNKNPMPAVCRAYYEVLEIKGKLSNG